MAALGECENWIVDPFRFVNKYLVTERNYNNYRTRTCLPKTFRSNFHLYNEHENFQAMLAYLRNRNLQVLKQNHFIIIPYIEFHWFQRELNFAKPSNFLIHCKRNVTMTLVKVNEFIMK